MMETHHFQNFPGPSPDWFPGWRKTTREFLWLWIGLTADQKFLLRLSFLSCPGECCSGSCSCQELWRCKWTSFRRRSHPNRIGLVCRWWRYAAHYPGYARLQLFRQARSMWMAEMNNSWYSPCWLSWTDPQSDWTWHYCRQPDCWAG